MRSTPWPNDTLRTVNVARAPPRCMPITMPSNTWMRSLSPSRTFTWTRTVSPGLIAGRWCQLRALDGLYGSHHDYSLRSLLQQIARSSRRSSSSELRARPAGPAGGPACAPAPRAAATARSPRGAPTAAPAAPPCPANSAGRVYCGKSSSPARERVARHRLPRRRPRPAPAAPPRRRSPAPAARRPTARSRRSTISSVARCCAHALVHPFVAAAQHHDVIERRSAARASACVNRRRRATSGSPRPGAPRSRESHSTARNSGSGFSTIPGPPPNGMSSTTRCRSVVWSRRSCTRTSSTPALDRARPTIPSASGASHHLREDGDDVDLHRGFVTAAPSRSAPAALPAASTDDPPRCRRSIATQMSVDQRDQHLAVGAVDHERLRSSGPSTRVTRPSDALACVAHLAADQVVPVERALRQRRQRRRRRPQLRAGQRLGVVHRLDAFEPDDRPALMEPDLANPPRRRRSAAHEQHLRRPRTAPRRSPSPG